MIKLQKIISALVMSVVMSMSAVSAFTLTAGVAQAQASGTVTSEEVLPGAIGTATGLGTTDVRVTIARVIRVAMGLLGIVAVVIILIGGFTWMTAGGNEEKVGEAKKWIFAGIIGLAIILSAYAIASFVINQLVSATTQAGPPTL